MQRGTESVDLDLTVAPQGVIICRLARQGFANRILPAVTLTTFRASAQFGLIMTMPRDALS